MDKVNEAFSVDPSDPNSESNGVGSQNGKEAIGEEPAIQTMTQIRVYKNLLVICIGFLFLFCAFQALANLQSTLNSEAGLGVASQSVIYASLILSSLFLPTFLIRRLGVKLTLIICMAAYCPYIAANYYATWWTMIPAAVILGLGAAPMWSAKCTYLNEIGYRQAIRSGEIVDTVIIRFFGIFFMFFQSSQIWGNLISYLVLSKPSEFDNSTDYVDTDVACGIDFVQGGNNTNLDPPSQSQKNLLISIYLGAGIVAVLLILTLLDPLHRDHGTKGRSNLSADLVVATFRHMKNKEQIILIPLTIYSGLEQAFFASDFSQAFIACAGGIHQIGFVAICFGVVNAAVSLSSGHLVKLLRRIPIFLIATTANIGTCVALLLWKPTSTAGNDIIPFFVIAGIWGLGDAVWQTQINAFYGVLFKGEEEPAFSNYRLWESLGYVMAFIYSTYINVLPKIIILLCFLVVGIAGYLYIEIKIIPQKKKALKE